MNLINGNARDEIETGVRMAFKTFYAVEPVLLQLVLVVLR